MTDFTITPPSQEDVDTHASLAPYTVTPSEKYKATLGTAERQENDSQTWVAVGLSVTIVATKEGEETVNEVAIAGRNESQNASTELFQRKREDNEWIPTIDESTGEIARRTDDKAQKAYSMSYKLLVQLFQAVGALAPGDTDLRQLGFIMDNELLNADAIVEALSGYEGAEVGAQIRNQARKQMNFSTGKKEVVRDDGGRPRREAVITDFFTLS